MCVWESKKKRETFLYPWDIYKNYCNWFDKNKIIWNFSCGFSFQRERVFHINISVIVCDCYFELIVVLIILFGTQQVVSELRLE